MVNEALRMRRMTIPEQIHRLPRSTIEAPEDEHTFTKKIDGCV
jgi:hypothetical protein